MPITGEHNDEPADALQHLTAALDATDMDEINDHIRQALQLLEPTD